MADIVRMRLNPNSEAVFRYTLMESPDFVADPSRPKTGVEPRRLEINFVGDETGTKEWAVGAVKVTGWDVTDGLVSRSTERTIMFLNPLDGEDSPFDGDKLPDWLHEIVQRHVNLMNRDAALRERQDEAAREAAHKMFAGLMPGDTGKNMADEIAEKLLTAIRRVG